MLCLVVEESCFMKDRKPLHLLHGVLLEVSFERGLESPSGSNWFV